MLRPSTCSNNCKSATRNEADRHRSKIGVARGELEALTPKKRGPKVVLNPLVLENRKLQAENARLQKRLQDAELIIDVQKKLSALLNSPIPEAPIHDEENA